MHSKLQHPELPGALAHDARLRRADINDVPHLFTLEQELFPSTPGTLICSSPK